MICSFHMGEFFTTALCNPTVVSSDSFMVNHSKAYTTAALISWTEFFVRLYFFPQINSVRIFGIGLFFVLGGQICRTWAMITCGESFNHYIQRDKKDNHILVTHGIYGFLRHPSYVGFFYWAVGTQLILCNPLSVALYTLASWTFFRHRIVYEEATLRAHFPGAYESYAEKTFIGIPLINAFVLQWILVSVNWKRSIRMKRPNENVCIQLVVFVKHEWNYNTKPIGNCW